MADTALVTGAAGGIGLAIVERLARDGHRVVATDVKPVDSVSMPEGAEYVAFDLLRETDYSPLLDRFEDGLDYFVYAAGVAMFDDDGSLLDVREEVWETTLAVNLHAVRRLTVAVVPLLRKGTGKSVVLISSIAGTRGMDSPLDAYQVSKAAVVSLSRSIGIQLGPEGIRCNTVAPGAILTPMIDYLYTRAPERRVDMERRTPMRRLGLPSDIAGAVAFLLSEDAAFVTSTDLVVDGGWSAQVV
jgi:NAD(P)-dependent dehydrogenase (short-subunit alcohol dehydrogenase family)